MSCFLPLNRGWRMHCGRGRLSYVHSEEVAMAIKRPTKSRGTPSHKPVASAPFRHVDVRAPQQMVSGEVYVGWLCKSRLCGRVIAIADAAPGDKALTDFDDQLTAINVCIVGMRICTVGALEANRNTRRKARKPE